MRVPTQYGYVALDFTAEMRKAEADTSTVEATFELPNGLPFTLGSERFRCAKALFAGSLLGDGSGQTGLVEQIFHAIAKCDADIQAELYANVVLAGGSSRAFRASPSAWPRTWRRWHPPRPRSTSSRRPSPNTARCSAARSSRRARRSRACGSRGRSTRSTVRRWSIVSAVGRAAHESFGR